MRTRHGRHEISALVARPDPAEHEHMARQITLLGLGRMGRAVAARLTARGHDVTTWTRSGGGTAGTPAAAVASADVVVLCLYDAAACAAVLDEVAGHLPPGAVVVNTATVGPQEAATLAQQVATTGARYLHAPVLGSTSAAASGGLTVLAGGDPGGAAPVLVDLGDVLACGDAAQAAAAKLVANGVLAGAALTVRDGLVRAARLDLPTDLALDVLERTALGALVRAKRDRLATGSADPGERPGADFTAAALGKDVALLAAALAPTASDADIAALMTPAEADPAVLAPLHDYAAGHATGDSSYHRRAFLPTAHVEGLREGRFTSWTLEEYCALFTGSPAPDEAARWRRVDQVSVTGTTGTATMTLHHGPDVFTDSFVLLRVDGAWRIANKTYHRA
ncbi:nuclear transport factor 2 family protein [Nocardioides daeguensis]|nr:nuclear transport factor 2 family protein [Nocardioides daeguensis]